MTAELLNLKQVVKDRGAFQLSVPQWQVGPGEVVGLVGPNGAGKTTLLRLLAGLDRPTSGEIAILGLDPVTEHTKVRSQCAFMWDDQPVFNVPIGRMLHLLSGYYPTWDAGLVDQLLERFDLNPQVSPGQLSRGQGTRLRLLMALAWRPRLLLLDEPASGLDLSGRQALLESVIEVAGAGDRSVIISSHQLADVERICDRLLVVNQGQIVQEGPTDALVDSGRTLEEAMVAWGAA